MLRHIYIYIYRKVNFYSSKNHKYGEMINEIEMFVNITFPV